MSNLLEEAIIDAKALKEAALKSAQEAILEKYNPEVKKALQNMLLEQEEQPLVDPDMDMLGVPEQTGGTVDGQIGLGATGGAQLCPCPDNEVVEIDINALQKAMMTADQSSGMTNDMSQPLPEPLAPAEEPQQTADMSVATAEIPPEETGEEPEALQEDVVDEEIELSEDLINSLLEDEELFEQLEEENLEEKLVGKQKQLDVAEPKGKLTAADFQALRAKKDSVEEDLRYQPSQDGTEAIKDSVAKEKLRIAVSQKQALVQNQLRENKVSSNETRLLVEKTSLLLEKHNKVLKENTNLTSENKRLLKENVEMQATALELSKQLEQLNVQNAKLYFKNQALSSVSLNERQKQKIVEAISKADSVEEVKIIYETLQSAVGSVDNTTKKPQSLSEAVTRNSGFVLRSKEKEEPVTNSALDRWQKIAGIKK